MIATDAVGNTGSTNALVLTADGLNPVVTSTGSVITGT